MLQILFTWRNINEIRNKLYESAVDLIKEKYPGCLFWKLVNKNHLL